MDGSQSLRKFKGQGRAPGDAAKIKIFNRWVEIGVLRAARKKWNGFSSEGSNSRINSRAAGTAPILRDGFGRMN
jgi:hypothetical protein